MRARLAEIERQRVSVASTSLAPPGYRASSTVGTLRAAFESAGGNASVLPRPISLPAPFNIDYNLATWEGSSTAYLTCNLALRGAEYIGMCTPMEVVCTPNGTNDTRPYNCTRSASNTTVPGTIRDAGYRCALPCHLICVM